MVFFTGAGCKVEFSLGVFPVLLNTVSDSYLLHQLCLCDRIYLVYLCFMMINECDVNITFILIRKRCEWKLTSDIHIQIPLTRYEISKGVHFYFLFKSYPDKGNDYII